MNRGDIIICIDVDVNNYFKATIGNRYLINNVNRISSSGDFNKDNILQMWIIDDTGSIGCYNPKFFIELSLYRGYVIENILS